jgi:hypothetical protein
MGKLLGAITPWLTMRGLRSHSIGVRGVCWDGREWIHGWRGDWGIVLIVTMSQELVQASIS